jgi:hypothetical protein
MDRQQYHGRSRPEIITIPEMAALCERLQARAVSKLLADQPEQAVDCWTAARVLSTLLKNGTINESVRLEG